jgi:2-polyprenyl-3-methyl-5-hydroxy-6-metoxy-1,4-benzoquinol methylase
MNIKSQISGFLRKTNLLSFAERMRFYWQKQKYKKENEEFKSNNPGFVLPPEFFIYETYRLNYKWYHDDGKNSAREIVDLLSKHLDLSVPGVRILDWGCGPGRIARHFPKLLPNAEIYGTDYNEKYIEWCIEHLKEINFSVNKIDPPINYNDNYFDVVIGLSIFTHLSEKGHIDWINELHRIVKPEGFIFISTHGKAYYSKLTNAEKKLFDSNDLVIREYSDEGNRLYSSFQPFSYIVKLIEGKFAVVENIEGKMSGNEPAQDIWLLKKI